MIGGIKYDKKQIKKTNKFDENSTVAFLSSPEAN